MSEIASPSSGFPADDGLGPQSNDVQFSPVRLDKFVLMSILTLGLYEFVWFFRNWRYVKQAENSDIWPWARALFAPLWYYALLKRLDYSNAAILVVGYWLLVSLWRLPDPYWLVSTLSFLPLVPAVQRINELAGDVDATVASSRWRWRNLPIGLVGGLAVLFASLDSFVPSGVVRGEQLSTRERAILHDLGVVVEGETILYFYSPGLLSIRGEGVVATDLGVTAYWTDPTSEELVNGYLPYERITSVEVSPGDAFEFTEVRLEGVDEQEWMVFFLSGDLTGDQEFLDEVERRRSAMRIQPP